MNVSFGGKVPLKSLASESAANSSESVDRVAEEETAEHRATDNSTVAVLDMGGTDEGHN